MSSDRPVALWFRNDLRLADQPAVHAAEKSGAPVLAFYILEGASNGLRPPGGASKWWLYHSLAALALQLEKRGCQLHLLAGEALKLVPEIIKACNASEIFWTRRYEAAEVAVDSQLKAELTRTGVGVSSYNGQLLLEPWDVKTNSGDPFRVFTPFWRRAREHYISQPPLPAPEKLSGLHWPTGAPRNVTLDELSLLPKTPDWAGGLREIWTPGESGAALRLETFINDVIHDYAAGRDFADRQSTSMLSPHLRFGEIAPHQIWRAIEHAENAGSVSQLNAGKFLSEIGWREFSYQMLFHNGDLATKNFNARFDNFPWPALNRKHLRAWQCGQTGYPIVDAGMRELWRTGYMHNRVRMIAASFLIKHLMIDWRRGEEWFWDTLCDADPANNAASWQWVAGSGADAAPYFRIFNPILQGEKFDPDGGYVRKHVPELKNLDTKYIHQPWQAPAATLQSAGIVLGETYPAPLIDHAAARQRALKAFAGLSG